MINKLVTVSILAVLVTFVGCTTSTKSESKPTIKSFDKALDKMGPRARALHEGLNH